MRDWNYPFTKPHSWDKRDVQWYKRYLELVQFKKEQEHCRVPKGWKDNPQLAHWVAKQRSVQAKMVSWRKELLDQLNFTWRINPSLDIPPKTWTEHYHSLKKFRKKYGHANVPWHWKENRRLANWVQAQRSEYKHKRLATDKIEKLNDVGFSWVLQKQTVKPWEYYYQQLLEFKKVHGHCNVPIAYVDKKLARWVARQRKIADSMALERKKLLETIGFQWRLRDKRPDWESRYNELKEFKQLYGHCNVPSTFKQSENRWKSLASWIPHQRMLFKTSKLSIDQINQLNAIGFSWNVYQDNWDDFYQQLVFFKQTYGHCQVSARWSEWQSLGSWVQKQRRERSILSPKKVSQLKALDFEWKVVRGTNPDKNQQKDSVFKKRWESHYQRLKRFYKLHGHCNVPKNSAPPWQGLTRWMQHQRTIYKAGKLNENQIDRLEQLGFSWQVLEDNWQAKFQQLKDYQAKEGHLKISRNTHPKLSKWLSEQKYRYLQGKVSEKRIKLLESIGFEWIAPRKGKK